MNKLFWIFILTLTYSISVAQSSNDPIIEWKSKFHYENIREAGQKYYFYQYCTNDMDSLIQNGILIFNASIKNIESCKYKVFIKDTIVQKIVIITKSKENTNQLRELVKNEYGNTLTYRNKNMDYVHYKVFRKNDVDCVVLFMENKRKSRGELLVSVSPL